MTFPKRTFEKPIPISPADRARPRALHPLLPLHALLGERRRGRPAGRAQPRLAVDDRDLRGRALPRALLRQRDRALPGRRADLDAVPLRGAAVGDPERADGLRPLPRRLQHHRDDARRARSSGSSRATIRRSTTAGSATRAASRSRTCTRRPRPRPDAPARPAPLREGVLGRRARRGRAAAARAQTRRGAARALRARDGRAGLRAGQARPAGAVGSNAVVLPRRRARRSTPSAPRSRRSADAQARRRHRRRAGRRAGADRRPLDPRGSPERRAGRHRGREGSIRRLHRRRGRAVSSARRTPPEGEQRR